MSDVSKLTENIIARLHDRSHSDLLKKLVDAMMEGGTDQVEQIIKEILSEIEEA